MIIRRKLAAGLGVIALVAAGAVVAPTAASATGVTYGTLTLSPAGPYNVGQSVTVSATGLGSPVGGNGGGILASTCVGNGNPQLGPGSCTSPTSTLNGSVPSPALAVYNFGFGGSSWSTSISIPGADAGIFGDYPAYTCGNGATHQCLIGIADFRGNGPTQVPIVYSYGTMSASPAAPYANADDVTLTYSGLTPIGVTNGGGWQAGVCVGGGNPQLGPGSCAPATGPSGGPSIKYFFSGADSTVTFKIIQGAAGFTDYPGYTCGNAAGHKCNLVISDFRGYGPQQIEIVYGTNQTETTTTLTASPTPGTQGANVDLTATVSPASAGTVQFKDGSTNLGTPVAVSSGTAVKTTSALAIGSHNLKAVFLPSDSTAVYGSEGTTTLTINKAAAVSTNTALSVTPSTEAAFAPVVLHADVTADTTLGRTLAGNVVFKDGTTTLGTVALAAGAAELTFSTFTEGVHAITAQFVPTDATDYATSTSSSVDFTATAPLNPPSEQDVNVTVVPGSMSITTPYSAASPFDLGDATVSEDGTEIVASGDFGTASSGGITITDTRAGNQAWTASAIATDFIDGSSNTISANDLSLTGLTQVYTAGNALQSGDVTVTDVAALGDTQHAFASTTNGNGTVRIYGTLGLNAPTSTVAGTYTATLTFTIA